MIHFLLYLKKHISYSEDDSIVKLFLENYFYIFFETDEKKNFFNF